MHSCWRSTPQHLELSPGRAPGSNYVTLRATNGGALYLTSAGAFFARRFTLQLLFYPGCGVLEGTLSHRLYGHGFLLDAPTIEWFFEQYIARNQHRDWRFSPLYADDVEGVAPAWIGLAECDPLVDNALAYGDKLRAAGVAVELEIWRGVTHDFIKLGRAIREAGEAHAAAAQALRTAFGL